MPNFILRAWLLVCRAAVYVYLKYLYQPKSWLYRWVFERRYRDVPVSLYSSIDELVRFIRRQVWTADGLSQGWDAFSYPGKIEMIGQQGDHKIGDCDEFALYIAYALRESAKAGRIEIFSPTDEVGINPCVLTVCWVNPNGSAGGHNVAFWQAGTTSYYMDYGHPSKFVRGTVDDAIGAVIQRYAKPSASCCGWSLRDPYTLAPFRVESK